ncbi:MAG: stage III sporulation protein AG [Bacillaceae bacterium]|nr:stage III sporulation protein AG [Bacillaceae bacterium]
MDKNIKDLFEWLKGLLGDNKDKRSVKFQYILIVLAVGIGFMLFSNLYSKGEVKTSAPTSTVSNNDVEKAEAVFNSKSNDSQPATITDYERLYETQLKEALQGILGVDDVTVVVNVEASELQVLQKNEVTHTQKTNEVDSNGGKRDVEDVSTDQQVVIVRKGEEEKPLVIETKKPSVKGVLVVAQGAESIKVQQMLIEAVTKVLDVPQHRVAVLPKKPKGE